MRPPPSMTFLTAPTIFFMSLLALAIPTRAAEADPIVVNCSPTTPCIDFAHTDLLIGGTVSYDGGLAPLVGSDIPINRLFGFFTPEGSGFGEALAVTNGFLNFETGPFISFNPIAGYKFAGGGDFTVTGSVPALGLVDQTLANGSFTQAFFLPGTPGLGVRPNGTDRKHPDVVDYFGLDPDSLFFFGGFITTDPTLSNGGPFSVNATSLDIPNTPNGSVPEPAALLLVLTGVVGVIRRHRRSRSSC